MATMSNQCLDRSKDNSDKSTSMRAPALARSFRIGESAPYVVHDRPFFERIFHHIITTAAYHDMKTGQHATKGWTPQVKPSPTSRTLSHRYHSAGAPDPEQHCSPPQTVAQIYSHCTDRFGLPY